MRIQLQPAYILHSQAFSNTSLLVDVFTENHGRFRLVAKGVRSAKSPKRALLQLFTPILLGWSGRSDLKTLTDIELNTSVLPSRLQGHALFNGIYINELLLKLTFVNNPHDELFSLYKETLADLSMAKEQEFHLRYFEYQLLECLGYGLDFGFDNDLENSLIWYEYDPEVGLQLTNNRQIAKPQVQGQYLFNLLHKKPCDEEGLRQLKGLMRFALHFHLDGKKIQSRVLYQ